MTHLNNTCEGSNAVAITNANSAPDNWASVTLTGTGSTKTFSTAQNHLGSSSMLLYMAAVASTNYSRWSGLTASSRALSRYYMWMSAYPTTATRFLSFHGSSSTMRCVFQVTPTGTIRTHDSAGSVVATSTAVLPLNAWARIEFECFDISGSTGTLAARMFSGANLEKGTPDSGSDLYNTGQAVGGTIDEVRFGFTSSVTFTSARSFYYDSCAYSDDDRPGSALMEGWGVPV